MSYVMLIMKEIRFSPCNVVEDSVWGRTHCSVVHVRTSFSRSPSSLSPFCPYTRLVRWQAEVTLQTIRQLQAFTHRFFPNFFLPEISCTISVHRCPCLLFLESPLLIASVKPLKSYIKIMNTQGFHTSFTLNILVQNIRYLSTILGFL